MTLQRLNLLLTIANLLLLAGLLAERTSLSAQGTSDVLRGRGLEILDEQGRVRASITRYNAEASYGDMVVFRLHDRQGKPMVKLDAHEGGPAIAKGSGIGFLGATDDTQAFIGASGAASEVDLKNPDGKRQQWRP